MWKSEFSTETLIHAPKFKTAANRGPVISNLERGTHFSSIVLYQDENKFYFIN